MEFTKSIMMAKRVLGRSAIFMLMTVIGFSCLELLVTLSHDKGYDIVSRFPELTIVLRAVTLLAWLEMSILWIRLMAQPEISVANLAKKSDETPMSSAIAFIALTVQWLGRMLILLKLCEFI